METLIKYGHTQEVLVFSDEERVLLGVPPQGPSISAEQSDLIREALAEPTGTGLLRDLAKGKENAVILTSDHTRPTPSDLILPLLLEELNLGGIHIDKVTVMIACGLHQQTKPKVVEAIQNSGMFPGLEIVFPDPDDEAALVDVGRTAMGTPVLVNRRVVEAGIVISVSTIEPHLWYGWSGGAKNVLPGVCSRKTVNTHHSRFFEILTGLDKIEGNPHREDAEDATRLAGLDFICNVVLNDQRKIVGAFCGDMVSAHRAGVELGRRLNVTKLPEKADILICALGGSPRDADLWQAEGKAMMHTQHLVKDGGIMIMATGCENGVGGEEFQQLLLKTPEEVKRIVEESDYSVPLMKTRDLVRVSERLKLWMVCPGIDPSDLPHMQVQFFPNIRDALEAAKAGANPGAPTIIVVPDSSRVVVSIE